jgi:SNF2 family DNA or RNA helicase
VTASPLLPPSDSPPHVCQNNFTISKRAQPLAASDLTSPLPVAAASRRESAPATVPVSPLGATEGRREKKKAQNAGRQQATRTPRAAPTKKKQKHAEQAWVAPPAPPGTAGAAAAAALLADEEIIVEWAQCDDPACGRWHELPPHIHPEDLPARFVCAMNNWGDIPKSVCVLGGSARRESLSPRQPATDVPSEHEFAVGDKVNVDRRRSSMDGGVGTIIDVSGDSHSVAYVVGGREKNLKRKALELLEAKAATTSSSEVDASNGTASDDTTDEAASTTADDANQIMCIGKQPTEQTAGLATDSPVAMAVGVMKVPADAVTDFNTVVASAAAAPALCTGADEEAEKQPHAMSAADDLALAQTAAAAPPQVEFPAAAAFKQLAGGCQPAKKPKQPPSMKAPPGTSSGNLQAKRQSAGNQPSYVPLPGYVCANVQYYSTLENETTGQVADKLGCDWKELANLKANKERYGKLLHASRMRAGTLLKVPTVYSKWRVRKLYETPEEEEVCTVCCAHEHPHDSPIMLCDGCDAAIHLACSALAAVPEGEYFCEQCLRTLRQRKAAHGGGGSLRACMPPMPALVPSHVDLGQRLHSVLLTRKELQMMSLLETHRAVVTASAARVAELRTNLIPALNARIETAAESEQTAFNEAARAHGIGGWGGTSNVYYPRNSSRFITIVDDYHPVWGHERTTLREREEVTMTNYWSHTRQESAAWRDAVRRQQRVIEHPAYASAVRHSKKLTAGLTQLKNELAESGTEIRAREAEEREEVASLHHEYWALLGLPRQHSESHKDFMAREFTPKLLGTLSLRDEADVYAMNLLCEPEELVILLPSTDQQIDAKTGVAVLRPGGEYAVFARQALFDNKRDDTVPIDASGARGALRRLMSLLLDFGKNQSVIVSRPQLPQSVRLREDNASQCFDLSNLVRDCNVPLDLPREPTPPRMAEHGLALRDYQEASLRWMLDKEREPSGLGSMGELWSRLRFLDDGREYFFCQLTGSLCLDIFDFRDDVGQKDASICFGGMPTGGILGEEMGLGKTMICLALTVSNPPPLTNRVLPRENLWPSKHVVQHTEYVPPPSVTGAIASGGKMVLSNGTLVVAPATLVAQWQNEVERYAPWLSVLTLHETENVQHSTVASADIVIVSTYLLQQGGGGANGKRAQAARAMRRRVMGFIRRTHWHRIFVDESHYNQSGETSRTKLVLAALSATHRHCVTGTPIGHSLDDLQGQLRFLRIAPFCRLEWWQLNIGNPYCARNPEALKILRSLLSRQVVRHSKEQQSSSGGALIALPPRTVETVLLPFGSAAEKTCYEYLETRNRKRFEDLRRESPATVASHYIELVGMMVSARQCCSHVSMVNLTKLNRSNHALMSRHGATAAAARARAATSSSSPSTTQGSSSREAILQAAVRGARHSAKSRVRSVVLRFQGGDLMECPVCLEPVSEAEISVTPCGHPFCSECILNVLGAATSTREASGDCPTCRDRIQRSEITFLGDASEAGQPQSAQDSGPLTHEAAVVVSDSHGFTTTATHTQAATVIGSAAPRANLQRKTEAQLQQQAREDRVLLHTLPASFLSAFDAAEGACGTKVARLLEEIEAMVSADPSSKAVAFSQFMGVLDVAAAELTARGIRYVRVDGTVKQHDRADALLDFANQKEIKVFLLRYDTSCCSMRASAPPLLLVH